MGLEAEQLQHGGMRIVARTAAKSIAGRAATPGSAPTAAVLGLALLLAAFAGLGQLTIACQQDFLVAAVELVFGGDVADGAVQRTLL